LERPAEDSRRLCFELRFVIGIRHTLTLPGIDADMREFGQSGIRCHERALLAANRDEIDASDHAEIARRLAGPRNGVVAAMDFVEGRNAEAKGEAVQVLTGPRGRQEKKMTCGRLRHPMIKSFRHRGLKRLFERDDKSQVRADMLDKIENFLAVLDHADAPEKMDLPGFRLHPMTGDLRGFWSVTVRANWRIIWRYDGADAVDVELIDYH
jgi:toxin HigB-1